MIVDNSRIKTGALLQGAIIMELCVSELNSRPTPNDRTGPGEAESPACLSCSLSLQEALDLFTQWLFLNLEIMDKGKMLLLVNFQTSISNRLVKGMYFA